MHFLNRQDEMRRLDRALGSTQGFAAIWGRRRVGKSRLLIEWCRRRGGLYAVADASAPAVQRRYFAAAVAARFPGFADVDYPDWRSFFERLAAEATKAHWPGPLILDELPYLITADPSITTVLQNWLDAAYPRPCLVVSGSSQQMMHGALLDAGAPLYGRASEAFAVRPLQAGYLRQAFPEAGLRELVSLYALWGGMPRYWELAQPFGCDLDTAVDTLVLDPAGILHDEPGRLLRAETPPATALRPLLDVIGAGAHRASEIGGRLGRPVSSLARPLAMLTAMNLVRREAPFGSDPKTGKRSLYRIDDPFLRLWFRVVAARRAMLAEAPGETRLAHWYRYRPNLEAMAWEELCRMSVPLLHRTDHVLARYGPWLPAQRYWHGNNPEFDIVARSVDGRSLLVGEIKWTARTGVNHARLPRGTEVLPGAADCRIVPVLFVPEAGDEAGAFTDVDILDARSVFDALSVQA